MTRLKAILLLLVFLFNSAGYYAIYTVLEKRHDSEFSEKLDFDEYSGSESIIVKIPFSLPYQPNFNGYERVEGEFMSDGEVYKMVKHNVVKDTLYLVMVKDKKEASMRHALADFTEGQHSSKSPQGIIDTVSKDFISDRCQLFSQSTGWSLVLHFAVENRTCKNAEFTLLTPPPELPFA